MTNHYSWRFTLLGIAFIGLGAMILGKTVAIQFSPYVPELIEIGDIYSWQELTIKPPRGQVYDRWGHLLAGNKTVYEVGIELSMVDGEKDARAIAATVNGILGVDYSEVYEAAMTEYVPGLAVRIALADYVSADKALRLQALIDEQWEQYQDEGGAVPSLRALSLIPHLERSYPEGDLASNVLGFVSRRDGKGYFGVEQFYEDLLAGESKTIKVPVDPNLVGELPEVPPGTSLILTIDREIQASVEEILDQAVETMGAKAGTVVVMDPRSGEILAMASTPRLDLNEYWRYPELFPDNTPFNRAVSKSYEPGSVFKVLTLASTIDADVLEDGWTYWDSGYTAIGGIGVWNWDRNAYGEQDLLGCMQYSLNTCMVELGRLLGPEVFYRYMNAFGVGSVTGVDLAVEVDGKLREPSDSDWYPADLGANTFGQGVSVTPVQMLMAVSAFANEGEMMMPHIVKAMVTEGNQHNTRPQYVGSPISQETAWKVSEILSEALTEEASSAVVPGYLIAGKTGTGEIPTEEGYTRNVTNASFVGWGPVDDPQFAVYVWLEEPTFSIWGEKTAAPVFAQVVERLVMLLNIPPDAVRQEMVGQ